MNNIERLNDQAHAATFKITDGDRKIAADFALEGFIKQSGLDKVRERQLAAGMPADWAMPDEVILDLARLCARFIMAAQELIRMETNKQ